MRPSNDSAPTAGPSAGSPSGEPADSWDPSYAPVSSSRPEPRVRFPAPYSPAGTLSRDSGPRSGASSSLAPRVLEPRSGSSHASGTSSGSSFSGSIRNPSAPSVRYDQGPVRRTTLPKTVSPSRSQPSNPSTSSGSSGSGVRGTKSSSGDLSPSSGKGAGKSAGTGATKAVENWRDLRKNDPKRSREIFVANKAVGAASEVGVGAVTGAITGVAPSGWRGGLDLDNDWVCDPTGWRGWSQHCGYWGPTWCGSWSGFSFAWYWSWYYPCWWWYSRPYYYYDYAYYQPVSTVIYTQPEVIYLQSEPVGETVVASQPAAPAGRIAPPAASDGSPLSIAAQRYLELGDRAFREGRYLDAVQFYAKAVEFAPDRGALYLVLSDALFAAGDYHYGAYAVRRALELEPELIETSVDKHGFYADPSEFDGQIQALERYLDEHPGDRDARLVLALNYLFGGNAEGAARTIEGASPSLMDDPAAQSIRARARSTSR